MIDILCHHTVGAQYLDGLDVASATIGNRTVSKPKRCTAPRSRCLKYHAKFWRVSELREKTSVSNAADVDTLGAATAAACQLPSKSAVVDGSEKGYSFSQDPAHGTCTFAQSLRVGDVNHIWSTETLLAACFPRNRGGHIQATLSTGVVQLSHGRCSHSHSVATCTLTNPRQR